ncbi:hypothetical protein PASE110613_17685 [Paenibacillus sediminis]|uniref:HEPN domain-containing protein n=1 Tax=Paenibacillus sediminis TaxID=664909 RepID=A0ABS4H275_9BACL|nr:hypothetical protein [Paenibacillus sediminis]MBP1936581.1 hypothetical protein [Paenibacillus sediminis]
MEDQEHIFDVIYVGKDTRRISEDKARFLKQDITEVINNPNAWIYKSKELKESADTLLDSILLENKRVRIIASLNPGKVMVSKSNYSTYYLLISFAIENILKGIYVLNNNFKLDNDYRIRPRLGHNLLSISNNLYINLSLEEEQILNKLTHYLIWEGRYPTPMNAMDFQYTFETLLDQDIERINEIYKKLCSVFEEGSNIT